MNKNEKRLLDDERVRMIIESLLQHTPCARFSEIKKDTGLHDQVLARLLDKLLSVGIINECEGLFKDYSGYALTEPFSPISLRLEVNSEVVERGEKVVMRHEVMNYMVNTSVVPIKIARVIVYGDVVWEKPLVFESELTGHKEIKLSLEECPNKYCQVTLPLNSSVNYGEKFKWKYEFYIYYFPPEDYFSYIFVDHAIQSKFSFKGIEDVNVSLKGCRNGVEYKIFRRGGRFIIKLDSANEWCVVSFKLKL